MVTITSTKLLVCFMVGVLLILIGGIINVVFHEVLPRKIRKVGMFLDRVIIFNKRVQL